MAPGAIKFGNSILAGTRRTVELAMQHTMRRFAKLLSMDHSLVCLLIALSSFVLLAGCGETRASRQAALARLQELRRKVESDPADPSALNKIVDTLRKGSTSFERTRAAVTLGELGALAEPAVPALADALNCRDEFVEREAARALGKIGPKAKLATPELASILEEKEGRDVSWFSAEALGEIGGLSPTEMNKLERASRSDDESLAMYASRALRQLQEAGD